MNNNDDGTSCLRDIECNGIGDIAFTDADEKKYYHAYKTKDLIVLVGNCVRILLEDDSTAAADREIQAFGQVLAIYEDAAEEMFIEVRWFHTELEVDKKAAKMCSIDPNELVETDTLDDIAAGSVIEVISIRGSTAAEHSLLSSSLSAADLESSARRGGYEYICRYMESVTNKSFVKVLPHSILPRGLELSHYRFAYVGLLRSLSRLSESTDPFSIAIQRLHVSVVPESLPCRSVERTSIEDYIRNGVIGSSARSQTYYICGMPGTGKTATVLASVKHLRSQVEEGLLSDFAFIEINCLRLKSPSDAYTALWRGLSGHTLSSQAAFKSLKGFFSASKRSLTDRPIVCLVDELDFLITRSLEVVYRFYEWSSSKDFVLITIANTMDLPERLSTRVSSRAHNTSRLVFKAYNFEQIQDILKHRLAELSLEGFDDTIREFVARKAAHVGGDLRAALRICQKTIEMYRDEALLRSRKGNQYVMKIKASSSSSISTAGLDLSGLVNKKEIMDMVRAAVELYSDTGFIATVTNSCQLDKAILMVMCQHKHSTTGGEVASDASMDCDHIWRLLCELTASISSERLRSPPVEPIIHLYEPPHGVFMQSLARLCGQGLVVRGASWKLLDGPRSVPYNIHESFSYSDFIASLKEDPLSRFILK